MKIEAKGLALKSNIQTVRNDINSKIESNNSKLSELISKVSELETLKDKTGGITLAEINKVKAKAEDALFNFKLSKKGYQYRQNKVEEYFGNFTIEKKKY